MDARENGPAEERSKGKKGKTLDPVTQRLEGEGAWPLDPSPMALLVFFPRPTGTSLIPPRLLNSGHRLPHALFSAVGRQLSRILR